MKFSHYLKNLLPTFTRDQVQEDLDTVQNELLNQVLPPYRTAVKEFGEMEFASRDAQAAEKALDKGLEYKYKGNHLTGILKALENTEQQLKLLQVMVDENFAVDITQVGLSTLRVNILQLVEIMGFTVRYARRHLNYILVCESASYTDKDPKDSFSAGELAWLAKGRDAFINGLNVLSLPEKELEVKFKAIPEVLITPDSVETSQSILGKDKTDPFQMRFIPLILNPIYHVRMRVADYQAGRYKEAQEERGVIELRLLLLKEQRDGRNNAKIERQIEYNEARLQKLNYKVEKMGAGHDA